MGFHLLPFLESLIEALEEEVRLRLRRAEGARRREVGARVGVIAGAVVGKGDATDLLRLARGRHNASAGDETHPQLGAHRRRRLTTAPTCQRHRVRDRVVRRGQQPLAMGVGHSGEPLAEGGEEGLALSEQAHPAIGAEMEQRHE